ncbi:hypothetical protein ABTM23_19170, partial [Acinetobacter baumannii]
LYIWDHNNWIVRKVDPSGKITNVAGIPGRQGFETYNVPATQSTIPNLISGMVSDDSGNILLYTDDHVTKILPNGNLVYFGFSLYRGGGIV